MEGDISKNYWGKKLNTCFLLTHDKFSFFFCRKKNLRFSLFAMMNEQKNSLVHKYQKNWQNNRDKNTENQEIKK